MSVIGLAMAYSGAAAAGPARQADNGQAADGAVARCAEAAALWWGGKYGIEFGAIDPATAIPLCEAATRAEPGNGDAWAYLARALNRAERYPEALQATDHAIQRGSAAGLWFRGVVHAFGDGVEQSEEEAVKWYRRAAERGYPPAQNNLGWMYENGRGDVAQSDEDAVKWYQLAAEQGYAPAQSNLGRMYANGRGLEQSDEDAVRWYRQAAEQGDSEGQNNLGWMHMNGRGVEQSDDDAVKWYRLAAEQGYATAQSNLGWMYENGRGDVEQSDEDAVKWYQLAAEQGHAPAQSNLGRMYADGRGVEQSDEDAVKWYRLAAEQDNAHALANLGDLLWKRGELAGALPYLERALAIHEKVLGPQHHDTAATLLSLGSLLREMGDLAGARPYLERALATYGVTRGPYHPDTALTLRALGLLRKAVGDFVGARPYFERALAIYQDALGPEDPEVAASLNDLGNLSNAAGDLAAARTYFERALAIYEEALGPQHPDTAIPLHNLGDLLAQTGELAAARSYVERALAIDEATKGPSHPDTAASLGNLGSVLRELGDLAAARAYIDRALAIREDVLGPKHPHTAASLIGLGLLLRDTGDLAAALPYFERANAIREEVLGPTHPDTGCSLGYLGELLHRMGDLARAAPYYERALAIMEDVLGKAHPDTGCALERMGRLLRDLGDLAAARPYYERAVRIVATSGQPLLASTVEESYSAYLAASGRHAEAIFFGKRAVNTLQGVRAGMVSLEESLQRSFLTSKEQVYRKVTDLLVATGRLAEAQQVLAMLKEQEYFDFVRRDSSADPRRSRASYTVLEAPWMARYAEISDRLTALGLELGTLRERRKWGLSEEESARYEALQADMEVARAAFDAFLGALAQAFAQADGRRAIEFGEKDLASLRALQGSLRRLGHGAVLVHYLITPERLRILVTTPEAMLHRDSAVEEEELYRRIFALREALQHPSSEPRPAAQALYAALIGPIAEDLRQARARTLMVSLDGALRYVPLAALHDGERYLVEADYAVVMFTPAGRTSLERAPQPIWRAAGLGVSRAIGEFQPLAAVPGELYGIVREPGESGEGVLEGIVRLDDAFTAAELRGALEAGFPVLHVASHFVFRPGTEQDSFLLLGDGARLSLAQIKLGDYGFHDVDLLTLSACETALGGGARADGREIEGFGVLAQNQGARAVLATLWPVADESTGQLMREVYRLREAQRLTKVEALRAAQQWMLAGALPAREAAGGDTRGVTVAGQDERERTVAPPYTHPYYWAPFVLIGNWL